MNKRVFGLPILLGVLSLVSAPIGLAWACTQQSTLSLAPASSVPQKAALKVTGEGFSVGDPVEIRWNDVAGPVLARSDAASFSVDVQVPPDVEPGTYYLVAVSQGIISRAPVEVYDPASSVSGRDRADSSRSAEGELWRGFGSLRGNAGISVSAGNPEEIQGVFSRSIRMEALVLTALGGLGIAVVAGAAIKRRASTSAPTSRSDRSV